MLKRSPVRSRSQPVVVAIAIAVGRAVADVLATSVAGRVRAATV